MPENGRVDLCPPSKPQKLRNKARKLTRKKVLKMIAVMERQQPNADPATTHSQEFLTSGRTGRRNALPDILSEHAVVSSADLPARLQSLTTNDGASTSTAGNKTPAKAETTKKNGNSSAS